MIVGTRQDRNPNNKDPVIPFVGIYPMDAQTHSKDTCSTMFIATLFVIARSGNNLDTPQLKNG